MGEQKWRKAKSASIDSDICVFINYIDTFAIEQIRKCSKFNKIMITQRRLLGSLDFVCKALTVILTKLHLTENTQIVVFFHYTTL